MYISTETSCLRELNDNRATLDIIKEAGFNAYDFSLYNNREPINYINISEAKKLRIYADEIGLVCNQTHAPFPSNKGNDADFDKKMFDAIIESFEISAILGAKICVVHPPKFIPTDEIVPFYNRLKPFAIKNGVKIGVENIWSWNKEKNQACDMGTSNEHSLLQVISSLDEKVFTALLDIGHAEMKGVGENTNSSVMIKALNNKIGGLHIHDNNKYQDLHLLPYMGKIDFSVILKALKEINYKGDITFECPYAITAFPLALRPNILKLLFNIGKYFYNELNS